MIDHNFFERMNKWINEYIIELDLGLYFSTIKLNTSQLVSAKHPLSSLLIVTGFQNIFVYYL